MQKWTTSPNKRNEPRSYFFLLKNLNRNLNTNINKIYSIFCTDTFHTSDKKKSLKLIMNQHSAFSLACEWILFVSAWQNSVHIKPENTEWVFYQMFQFIYSLPVALDQSKSTAGTSLSEGFTALAWSRGHVRQWVQNRVEELETFRVRIGTLGIS